MTKDRTTFSGRRLGYNEVRQKELRNESRKKIVCSCSHWFGRMGWKLLVALVVVGVIIWQGWFFVRQFDPTQIRTLKKIEISGNRMLTWEEIIQTAQLEVGSPMSQIHVDSIQSRLLKLPLVRSVEVEESFPWSVQIQVQESSPLMVSLEKDGWKVYSERAMVLPMATSGAYQLPVATALSPMELQKIAKFLFAMKTFDEPLYRNVSQVAINQGQNGIEVFFRNVEYKTLFPIEVPTADLFVHYQLLVQGLPQELANIEILDMRFIGFAYTIPLAERHDNG